MQGELPLMGPMELGVIGIFSLLSLQFVIGMQAFKRWSAPVWEVPSWVRNPFNFREPVQFFHFAAWFMILSFLPVGILMVLEMPDHRYVAAAPIVMGVSMLAGVHLARFVFRKKFRGGS